MQLKRTAILLAILLPLAAGCRSDRSAQTQTDHTTLGGNGGSPGNGSVDNHGTGHDDRSNSLNGLH